MGYSDKPEADSSIEIGGEHVDIVYSANAARGSRRRCYRWIGGGVLLSMVMLGVVIALTAGGGGGKSPAVAQEEQPLAPTPAPTTIQTAAPTTQQQAVLGRMSRTNGVEFKDEESYQSKALNWIEENPFSSNSVNKTLSYMDRQIQRYALACFYFATYQVVNSYTDHSFGGFDLVPWHNNQSWVEVEDECHWFGIGCDKEGHVIWIDLENNALTGSLPHEISYLGKSLRYLHLDGNFFHNKGDEGHDFLARLVNLRNLSLQDTFMQYRGLPPQLGHLSLLESLDLSYAVYLGEISEELFAGHENPLSNLLYLDISGNSFHAPIPRSISGLPSLKAFYARDSDIKGGVDFVADMKKVEEIWIDDNPQLTGPLPSNLDDASELQSFSVTNCDLTGSIPTSIGNMEKLKQVWLYRNRLSGFIPTELALLPNLKVLEIDGNQFEGEMPDEICMNKVRGKIRELHGDCPCDCCDCCGTECSRKGPGNRRQRKAWL